MSSTKIVMKKRLLIPLLLLIFSQLASCDTFEHKIGMNESTRIFSPRIDYDEWTPLGRGDPLKNDPTFDYVPPVLDRVQYWLGDTQASTESSSKRDVLVLGVTAKKTSPKIPDHFLKYMDSPIFPDTPVNFRNDFTGATGAEPPKIIRNTKFRTGPPSADFKITNKGYYSGFGESSEGYYEKHKPYTMMLPPPINSVPNKLQFGVNNNLNPPVKSNFVKPEASTSSSVSFEKSNLIYHQSSQQSVDWPSANPQPPLNNAPLFSWQKDNLDHYEVDHHQAASMNHEVVVSQNANIIVDVADQTEDKEEIVIGHNVADVTDTKMADSSHNKMADSSHNKMADSSHNKMTDSNHNKMADETKMAVVLANSSTTPQDTEIQNNVTVSVVMPTNFKQATTKSIITSTPKPTTELNLSAFEEMSSVTSPLPPTTAPVMMDMSWQQDQAPPPMFPMRMPPKMFRRPPPHRPIFGGQKPMIPMPKPINQLINQKPMMMFTPEAFRLTTIRPSPLGAILRKETTDGAILRKETTDGAILWKGTTEAAILKQETTQAAILRKETTKFSQTTTTEPTTTTTSTTTDNSFTTDPIFSHYKQPAAPLHGPMYLIIQGHSKVKTYKPTINKHGVPVEVITTNRPISKFEQFVNENTRREKTTTTTEKIQVKDDDGGHDSLFNLVERGVSAFMVPEE